MSGLTAFLVAVSGASLACYLVMGRVQNRKSRRRGAGGDTSCTGSGDNAGGGWNLSWFGSDGPSSDSCTSSSDSGADSGGGGDGGGGGD
jgi:hypothetical protein